MIERSTLDFPAIILISDILKVEHECTNNREDLKAD